MAKDLFSGVVYDSFTTPFTFSNQLNTIISNLGLFRQENHTVHMGLSTVIHADGDRSSELKSEFPNHQVFHPRVLFVI